MYDIHELVVKLNEKKSYDNYRKQYSCAYIKKKAKITYNEYIHSPVWKQKARQRMRLDKFRCQMCGTGKNLCVHHVTYDRLGDENMDDLVTVCKSCHEKIHREDLKYKRNRAERRTI